MDGQREGMAVIAAAEEGIAAFREKRTPSFGGSR